MTRGRRIELLSGIATLVAGLAALSYAAFGALNGGDACITQGTTTDCEPASAAVVLATLMFTPILLGILGFTLADSSGRGRGSLPFLWLFALLLAVATGVALLPLVVIARGLHLPSGFSFLPSVALALATGRTGHATRGSPPAQVERRGRRVTPCGCYVSRLRIVRRSVA